MKDVIIYIVDDDADVRAGLCLLCESAGFNVESYDSAESFLSGYRPDQPGCLVLDVCLEGMSGPELHEVLRRKSSPLAIIYLTGHGDIPLTVRAIRDGAVNLLTKPVAATEFLDAIQAALVESRRLGARAEATHDALAHIARLTEREREVLFLAAEGLPNKEIARRLNISYRTVEVHKGRIIQKTGATSVLDLARLAAAAGLRD